MTMDGEAFVLHISITVRRIKFERFLDKHDVVVHS